MNTSPVFQNLKVIDLSTVLAGPSVGSFFGELGAEVLKIENPRHPDITRSWKLPDEDAEAPISAYFSSVNYKKKYLDLDYETEEGKKQLLSHIEEADIVLMNFKYGLQDKLGLSDEVLRKNNPQLIIGKISGFGDKSDRVAYDLILQAETGYMSMNGTPNSGPVKMPVAFIDILAAHNLKQGIMVELLNKAYQKDYHGKTVSVSLYDAAVTSLANQAANYLMAHHVPKRIGSLHPNIAPYGEMFKTADQKTITFAIGSNRHFQKLCEFLKVPELAKNEDFQTVQARVENRTQLFEELFPRVKEFKAVEILDRLKEKGVPCGEVKDLAAVFETQKANRLVIDEQIGEELTRRVTGVAFQIN